MAIFLNWKARAVGTDDKFVERIDLAVGTDQVDPERIVLVFIGTDDSFFRTDSRSRWNRYQIFAKINLSQLSVISCNTKSVGMCVRGAQCINVGNGPLSGCLLRGLRLS